MVSGSCYSGDGPDTDCSMKVGTGVLITAKSSLLLKYLGGRKYKTFVQVHIYTWQPIMCKLAAFRLRVEILGHCSAYVLGPSTQLQRRCSRTGRTWVFKASEKRGHALCCKTLGSN